MRIQGAVIREQGVVFAVVIVKMHIIDNRSEARSMIEAFQRLVFPGIPVILMAQNYRGIPTYLGRTDIAKLMANTPLTAVPWKEYTVTL